MNNHSIKKIAVTLLAVASLSISACQTLESQHNPNHDVMSQSGESQNNPDVMNKSTLMTLNQTAFNDTLAKHQWTLNTVIDSKGSNVADFAEKPAQLSFQISQNSSRYSFDIGCNSLAASITIAEGQLTPSQMLSTLMYCADVDNVERKLSHLMGQVSHLSLSKNTQHLLLKQVTADGTQLIWISKDETDDIKHTETVFFEVQPTKKPCSTEQHCLVVREIFYDKRGIQTATGDWHVLTKPIAGFTHNDNAIQTIRVNRITRNPSTTKGNQLSYVLDMVVGIKTLR